jgi:N-acetylated-alpha-linked acidic dipeptidase
MYDLFLDSVYPATQWMPPLGAALGSLGIGSGIEAEQNPIYPAKKNLYRKPMEKMDTQKIPTVPLSYADAYRILERMSGDTVFPDWQGGLNISYRFGPGMLNGETVRVEVHSRMETRFVLLICTRLEFGPIYFSQEECS